MSSKGLKKDKRKLIIAIIILTAIIATMLLLNGKTTLKLNKSKDLNNYSPAETSKNTLETAIENLRKDEEEKGETLEIQDLPRIDSANIDIGSTDSFPVRAICDNYIYEIDTNFNVTYKEELAETNINYSTVPEQYAYTNKDKVDLLIRVTNNNGLKTIYSPDGGQKIYANDQKSVYLDYSVDANGIYPIKVVDSNNNERTKNIVINKIDRLPPKDFTITAYKIGDQFVFDGKTDDQEANTTNVKSGMDHYEYYLVNTDGEESKHTSSIFSMSNDATYRAYVIAYDKAGNSTRSAEIPVLDSGIVITPSTTDWTNQDINVSVAWNNIAEGINKQISTDGGTTYHTYTGSETINKNTKVIAKVEDSGIEVKQELIITNIDKISPTSFTPTLEEISDTELKIINEVQDGEATTEYGKSGINNYSYEVYFGATLIDSAQNITDSSWTASSLIPNKTYDIKVTVTDKAGNTTTSTKSYEKQLYSAPVIVTLNEISKSTNTIEVEAIATRDGTQIEGATYKFYIKKSGEADTAYEEKQSGTNNRARITGLNNNTSYMIKVEVIDSIGQTTTTQKQIETEDFPDITQNDGTLEFSEVTWQNGKASTIITTNTSYTIEYNINSTEGTWLKATSTSKTVNDLNHGNKVYARLSDGTNASDYKTKLISDKGYPRGEIQLDSDTVQAGDTIRGTVTAQDDESGITFSNCKWIMNNNANALGIDEGLYTGGNLSETGALEIETSTGGFYYIHVLLMDNAQNKIELIKRVIIEIPIAYNYTTTDMVEYDAGQWTEGEIEELNNSNLYNINISKSISSSTNHKFGGFTYFGDSNSENIEAVHTGTITTSRNKSIAPSADSGNLEDMSDGWKVLEYGEIVDNKKYVKSIVHAGAPENLSWSDPVNSYANYAYVVRDILLNRNWNMYKDKKLEEDGLIKEVHAMTRPEALAVGAESRKTGATYWLATSLNYYTLYGVGPQRCYD